MPLVDILVDGSQVVSSGHVSFSAHRECSLRLGHGGIKLPRGLMHSDLQCTLRDGDECLATMHVQPPTDEEDWVRMPGGLEGKRSLTVDVPGYTFCLDAFDGGSRLSELCSLHILHHRPRACSPATGVLDKESPSPARPSDPQGCTDVDDMTDVRREAVHGEYLRHAARDTTTRAWAAALTDESRRALAREAMSLVRDHGCIGRSFWVGATDVAHCGLEAFALEVLRFHSRCYGYDDWTGAEWWLQLRSCDAETPSGCQHDTKSIAFHFDCDEDPEPKLADVPAHIRLTLLVNLWRQHKPLNPSALPRNVALAVAPSNLAAHHKNANAPYFTCSSNASSPMVDYASVGEERGFPAIATQISPSFVATQGILLRHFPAGILSECGPLAHFHRCKVLVADGRDPI
ncbi:hypothetical protein AB1Y20_020270 [Prymnesium parvum]|uniref:Uncharacterized protein n=1 Tax=Prymnesium parvum TaxID=97485 RepID=A0AB34JU72_PRYPA